MSKPLANFKSTIARARQLCELRETVATLSEPDDLLRSAIVLSVAGFDAYFTDKFSDILVPYLKTRKPGPTLIKILEDSGLNAETALEIAVMHRPFRRIRTLVQAHVSSRTTQRFQAIDELFLSIGVKDLCTNAQRKTGYAAINSRVEAFVLKRHVIAHRADLDTRGKPQKIDAMKTIRRIDDLEKLVIACDEIINAATRAKKSVRKPRKKAD